MRKRLNSPLLKGERGPLTYNYTGPPESSYPTYNTSVQFIEEKVQLGCDHRSDGDARAKQGARAAGPRADRGRHGVKDAALMQAAAARRGGRRRRAVS